VLCADEKSSVQALDRTQASLPMVKGPGETMTHYYRRHGTTTLFAALNVLTGMVISECMPRHRHQEWLKFLKSSDRQVTRPSAKVPRPTRQESYCRGRFGQYAGQSRPTMSR